MYPLMMFAVIFCRFWYVSLVSCYRNVTTCTWHYYDYRKFNNAHAPSISFDVFLVNGNPKQKFESPYDSSISPLEYHFSFDQQYILQMYLIFFAIYLILVPLQIAAARLQKHPVTRLFTVSLTLEFISLCFMLGHWIRFAFDGVGNENLCMAGSIFDIFGRVSGNFYSWILIFSDLDLDQELELEVLKELFFDFRCLSCSYFYCLLKDGPLRGLKSVQRTG